MKRISSLKLVLACAAASSLPVVGADELPEPRLLDGDYLTELADRMRTNHPALRAADKRAGAARSGANAVRSWDDPEIMLGGMAAREEMRADDGDIIYGIRQPLPLFGRPRAEREAASAQLNVALAETELRFQFLRRDLAKALFEAAVTQADVRATDEDVAYLATLEVTAQARYQAGDGSQLELLRVQNELARRREQQATAKLSAEHDQFTLNRFLNQPFETPWPAFQLPEPASPVHFNRELAGVAARFEPMLQVIQRQVDAADADTEVARRRYRPEVSVGLEGRTYSGDGSFRQGMLLVGLKIPWFNRSRYREDVFEKQSIREALAEELRDQEIATSQEVHELTVIIDDARRRALLQRDQITPRTRTMLESAHAAWLAGTGSLRDLLEIRRLLVESELACARAVADQYIALSDLILCCGLSDLQMVLEIGARPDPEPHHSPEDPSPSQP
jgi:outer membrane protein TolC